MKRRAIASALTLLVASSGLAADAKFSGFEVTSPEDLAVRFQFSAADATSSSPVVITIPGRKLTNDDRKLRVSLQKHWLAVNVPEIYKFVGRTLSECALKRKDEFSACDRYVFEEPVAKKQVVYFIYVGNWP